VKAPAVRPALQWPPRPGHRRRTATACSGAMSQGPTYIHILRHLINTHCESSFLELNGMLYDGAGEEEKEEEGEGEEEEEEEDDEQEEEEEEEEVEEEEEEEEEHDRDGDAAQEEEEGDVWQALPRGGPVAAECRPLLLHGLAPPLRRLGPGAYGLSLLSSTSAVLVTPPRVPLSVRLGENHAPNVSNKMCLR